MIIIFMINGRKRPAMPLARYNIHSQQDYDYNQLKQVYCEQSLFPVNLRYCVAGTSQKITQWIVSLLRDPRHNPSVITWHCERDGVFVIRDTERYARLWGEVKHNTNMTYEKLSRAMRYSYRNDELEMVPEQRLTYRFGASMADWRALDSDDPNFERRHSSSSSELDR